MAPGSGATDVAAAEEERNRVLVDVYAELRMMADRLIRNQRDESLLQATALANEAFLKLSGHECLEGVDRPRLLAIASAAMRNLLVDRARARNRLKRCPQGDRVPFEEITIVYEDRAVNLVALHDALERLSQFDPEMARAVELRFFGGLSMEETATCLEIPLRTLERRWEVTRRWLREEV